MVRAYTFESTLRVDLLVGLDFSPIFFDGWQIDLWSFALEHGCLGIAEFAVVALNSDAEVSEDFAIDQTGGVIDLDRVGDEDGIVMLAGLNWKSTFIPLGEKDVFDFADEAPGTAKELHLHEVGTNV